MENTIHPTTGFAVVFKRNIPYTSAPEMLGGGAIFQVYKNEEDALKFLEIPFGDAEYEIRPVVIFDAANIQTIASPPISAEKAETPSRGSP